MSKNFGIDDLPLMKKGYAPKVLKEQSNGELNKYILHHQNPIHNGGNVYSLDNLFIVTPRQHQEILEKSHHFTKGQ